MTQWSADARKKVLVLSSSPRVQGNSRMLCDALAEGAREAGHETIVVNIVDYVREMLRYCHECRRPDGACSIEDRYRELFIGLYLPADAVVFGTPIYWYGMSAQLKTFFDRFVCYGESSPDYTPELKASTMEKKVAVVLSAEESNFPARAAIMTQVAEFARYMRCDFVGVVTGIGNRRGEVVHDPANPLEEARTLGRRLFAIESTDYMYDVPRSKDVWGEGEHRYPAMWR